jgi:hypothetical protein
MEKIVQTLHSELEALESERQVLNLKVRTLDLKIQGIKNLLAVYEPPTAQSAQPSENTTSTEKPNGHGKPPANSTKNDRLENAIVELLRANGQMHRQAILDYLNAQGIMGGEKNPIAHLAAFLSSRRKLFISDGRGNFRLV